MNIQQVQSSNQSTFGAKFKNNKAFKEVAKLAEKKQFNNEYLSVDTFEKALNKISRSNDGVIELKHGVKDGKPFSDLILNGKKVSNKVFENDTPAEASYRGIMELGDLGDKWLALLGLNALGKKQVVSPKFKAQDLISRYTA